MPDEIDPVGRPAEDRLKRKRDMFGQETPPERIRGLSCFKVPERTGQCKGDFISVDELRKLVAHSQGKKR